MISPERMFECITEQGIRYFTGVPDSLLKDFCAYITDNVSGKYHVIAANEGNAIALATGWYLGSGKPALVYMQNSGIGNATNPLLSLADPEVYSIPLLIMVGSRGEPGKNDEPQHIKQGRVLTNLLDSMELPWFTLNEKTEDPSSVVGKACELMRERQMPVVLVVSADTFGPYSLKKKQVSEYPMSRESALKTVIDLLVPEEIVVSTTGKLSRELYEYRESRSMGHKQDFLTVGSMGHSSSIAMGLATARSDRLVICLDGDGSAIMHMGALAIIGQSKLQNLVHIIFNNGSHDSVGGQPTVGFSIDLCQVAKACGYIESFSVSSPPELESAMRTIGGISGPVLLEIRVCPGARSDLGRPKSTPRENRDAFMKNLGVL